MLFLLDGWISMNFLLNSVNLFNLVLVRGKVIIVVFR